MSADFPVILIELVLVFGGVLLFGWWQLRDVKRAQREAAFRKLRDLRKSPDAPPSEL